MTNDLLAALPEAFGALDDPARLLEFEQPARPSEPASAIAARATDFLRVILMVIQFPSEMGATVGPRFAARPRAVVVVRCFDPRDTPRGSTDRWRIAKSASMASAR